MHKCIFTLGLILASIYTTTAMAWPTQTATGIWTNSGHTTLATMHCGDCCKTNCWLPDGTYYNDKGSFTRSCGGEPTEPTCRTDGYYITSSSGCRWTNCPSGKYDIGFSSCVDPTTNGTDSGLWRFKARYDGETKNADTYGLTGPGQWAVEFPYGVIKGIASCNSTKLSSTYSTTDTEFNNTVTGLYCWCKMTSPATSKWVFVYENHTSADQCAEDCVGWCTSSIKQVGQLRNSLYGSVY